MSARPAGIIRIPARGRTVRTLSTERNFPGRTDSPHDLMETRTERRLGGHYLWIPSVISVMSYRRRDFLSPVGPCPFAGEGRQGGGLAVFPQGAGLGCCRVPEGADHFFGADAELGGVAGGAFRCRAQLGGSLLGGEGRRYGYVGAVAAAGEDDACGLELAVGPGDGAGCEAQVGGELADRREAASRRQHPAGGHRRYLRPDLL